MKTEEILEKIKKIIFAGPDEIYKFKKPKSCCKEEWKEASAKEKAYLLIQDIFYRENELKPIYEIESEEKTHEIYLGKLPRFFSNADENMFFNAIYSMPSYVKVSGAADEIYYTYKEPITSEELRFLFDLLKRYQVEISQDLRNITTE